MIRAFVLVAVGLATSHGGIEGAGTLEQAPSATLQELLNTGRDAEALPLARELAASAAPGRAAAEARHALGFVLLRLGEHAKAAEALVRALREFEKISVPAEQLGSVADAAAVAFQQSGNSREAERLFRRALAERLKAESPEPWANTTRAQLAKLLLTLGRLDEARELLALAVPDGFRAGGEITAAMAAQRWQTLAHFHQASGSYDDAARCLTRALEGGDDPALRNDLGMAMLRAGRLDDAQRELESARKVAPESLRAIIANNLAVLCLHRGEPARALEFFREAGKRDDLVRLGNVAAAAHGAGELELAVATSREAVALARRRLPAGHPLRAQLLLSAAAITRDSGADAAPLAREASAAARVWLGGLGGFGAQEEMLAFRATADAISPLAAFAAEDASALADAVLATKGAALEQSLRHRRWVAELGVEKERELREATAALETASQRDGADSAAAAGARRRLDALPKPPQPPTRGWKEAVAALPEGAVLIEFVRWHAHLGSGQWEPRYSALILKKGTQPEWLSVGRAEVVERLVGDFLATAERLSGQREPDAATPLPLASLWETIWLPVEKHAAAARQIFVRPDGMLHLVPWAVLSEPESGQFLCQRHADVQIVAAPQAAAAGARAGEWHVLTVPAAPGVVAPAAAALPMTAELWSQLARMPALPGVGREAAEIQASAGREVRITAGATEARLREVAGQKPAVLHVASHAFSLGAGAAGNRAPYCTGLVFADAAGAARGSEGVLFSAEAAALSLEKTELVTLSACLTGTGRPEPGEHVNGLRRAFLTAGAKRVVSTLWSLRDESAGPFVARLYPGIASEPRALWQAQREWLEGRLPAAAAQSPRLRILTAGAWIAEGAGWR